MARVSQTTYFRVGLFALAAVAMLVATMAWLGLFGVGAKPHRYYVRFAGSVVGLRERASQVLYRGVPVGTVAEIHVDSHSPEWITVGLDIRPEFTPKADMTPDIIITNLTGIRDLELEGGTRESPDLPPGGTITGIRTSFEEIGTVAQDLGAQTSSMLQDISSLLNEENRKRFASLLAHVDELTTGSLALPAETKESLQAAREAIETLERVANRGGDDLSETLAAARRRFEDPRVEEAIKASSQLVDRLNALVGSISQAVGKEDLAHTVKSADELVRALADLARTANGILTENRAEVRRIVSNLPLSSENLRETSLALRNNPSALVRSAPAPERGR
ncbi:MAG: MlaD family protein [Candidatus Sumerlaeota bacterium]|nr:MlaD family protein [Candidatus Sumerlaeota bacterium]